MNERQLQPCGTNAAWTRHKRHNEPIDDACAEAHRAYSKTYAEKARAQYPEDICAGCHRQRPIARYGWCESCVTRWQQAGRPPSGPPPLDLEAVARIRREVCIPAANAARSAQAADRYGEFAWLRGGGENLESIAERLGISHPTARRYNYLWFRREMGLPLEKAAARMGIKLSTARNWDHSLEYSLQVVEA